MKVSSINTRVELSKNRQVKNNQTEKQYKPAFKSAGAGSLLSMSASLMQWIESKGYLISFLIQDGLGMTAPRVWTGFNRDKEITGQYNIQEGFEVLGREGSTGPYIIGVAPAVLFLTGKFCKSTNTNTRLIKRMAQNMKNMIEKPEFNQAVKTDAQKFKNEFFNYNISKIYKDTIPNDNNAEETIKYLQEEFAKYNSKDKKASEQASKNIIEMINNKILQNSTNLYSVNKVVVGEGKNKASFGTGEVLRAIKDFGDDAITNNPSYTAINTNAIENMKNNFAAKRWFTNIANIVVTLGGLSILPKLYAPSDVSPSAKALESMQHKGEEKDSSVAFKGKGVNNGGFFASLGKFITKYTPEKMQELLEYKGYNFSSTTFALLATLGLLLPRGKRAWDRAQIDENGKRDMTEINEILLRDTVSSLSVVFAVPMLTKALVRSYEDAKGFILTNRASDGKNMFKKALDIINPYSDLEVLSVADLDAIYGNIDSKAKLMNFSNFVNNKGGDLEKILSKSENKNLMFNENTFTLESIKNLSKEEKNKKIIELFERIEDTSASKEGISKLMKGSGGIKNNGIAKMARGLNSLPGAISTVFISPIILGVLIPMLTYYNTRKANEKKISAEA